MKTTGSWALLWPFYSAVRSFDFIVSTDQIALAGVDDNYLYDNDGTPAFTPTNTTDLTPEPATWALLSIGLAAVFRRRPGRQAQA